MLMTIERIMESARACAAMLTKHAALMNDLLETTGPVAPKRLDERHMQTTSTPLGAGLSHLLFMCGEIERIAADANDDGAAAAAEWLKIKPDPKRWYAYAAKREKAMRWLGFVQGSLWSWNIASIDEMKRLNAPDPDAFEQRRDGAA